MKCLHPNRPGSHRRSACAALLMAFSLALHPAAADVVTDARTLAASGDIPAAVRKVERALEVKPRDVQLRFLLGVLLMDSQRDDAAMTAFLQLSQEYPELPDPYNNMALLHARAGRLEAALVAVQEALRAEPSHRTAQANLGQLHMMLAIKAWESLALAGPVEPALRRRLEGARSLLMPAPVAAR